jgi:hypothetical protein
MAEKYVCLLCDAEYEDPAEHDAVCPGHVEKVEIPAEEWREAVHVIQRTAAAGDDMILGASNFLNKWKIEPTC